MLQRKLILILGIPIVLILVAAIVDILLLQGVIGELRGASVSAAQRTAETLAVDTTLDSIAMRLSVPPGQPVPFDQVLDDVQRLESQLTSFESDDTTTVTTIMSLIDALGVGVGDAAIASTSADREAAMARAHQAVAGMRQALIPLVHVGPQQTEHELRLITDQFRWRLIGLAAIFIVVINVSIIALLRAAMMIIRPIDKLVEASRHLAREEFDYRVQIDQMDEFAELARASNGLAEQLERNEARRVEVLQQVARTLSHELNNAISIIDLQLELVARTERARPGELETHLHNIHETLGRMQGTVETLKQARRIVLTDYVEGVTMLDLERSAAPDEPREPVASGGGADAR
jgi:signal transduction histidine kinase